MIYDQPPLPTHRQRLAMRRAAKWRKEREAVAEKHNSYMELVDGWKNMYRQSEERIKTWQQICERKDQVIESLKARTELIIKRSNTQMSAESDTAQKMMRHLLQKHRNLFDDNNVFQVMKETSQKVFKEVYGVDLDLEGID